MANALLMVELRPFKSDFVGILYFMAIIPYSEIIRANAFQITRLRKSFFEISIPL